MGPEDSRYVPEPHAQHQAELHYRLQATGRLTVMPNFQYIKDPAGVRQVDDAWVTGLQVQTQL